MPNTKTYSPKASDIRRAWHVIDAAGATLGRLASKAATMLKGKHKPGYAPHLDTGDYVIVINAEKVRVSGRKGTEKMYYRHSGYPGGFKAVSLANLRAKFPERVIEHAVKGMLPHNSLGRTMFRKLKVYGGPKHPHEAQVVAPGPRAEKAAP